ncbi:MFS transporter [Adhaeretor mobilis]|uniref:Nucleoside transporter YegT n=1 Tax=Adhaeretor mobilis TaxID=1930276 RepID=A0A517N144_9BACT|nr:MFS transporter [Adhaeretor mobilis]QDT00853.1 Putative nucleoside transporter YegT [Adhaeretor mobilis]
MGVKTRLCIMMFLQFFTWSAWFNTLGLYMGANGLGDFIAGAYGSAPIAALIAPLFLGLVADRFFASQRVMGVLMLLGGGLLFLAPTYAASDDPGKFVWVCIAHMLCYMPTLGLSNTIAFSHIGDQDEFPKIRVWGTIGWIVAGLVVGFSGWSASPHMFQLGGYASIALGLFCFTLPHTPPPAAGKPVDMGTLFMADAWKMLAEPAFLIFIAASTLICIPLAYYYAFTSMLLGQMGFAAPAATMTLGQMSEIIFMLLIPFFFRRLGVKWMIVIGMAAWAGRYLLMAYGAESQTAWMILLAVVLHGVCYDFFFVTGFMYTDRKAPAEVRGQAQSLLVFFTQGVGMYIGYAVAGKFFANVKPKADLLSEQLANDQPASTLSLESLGSMFSVKVPESVDPQIYQDTMTQWKEFWITPAWMALAVLVAFALLFYDKRATKKIIEEQLGDNS